MHDGNLLSARRYASLVLPYLWPCICPSVCHKSTFYGNIGTDRTVFAWRLLSTYHTVL